MANSAWGGDLHSKIIKVPVPPLGILDYRTRRRTDRGLYLFYVFSYVGISLMFGGLYSRAGYIPPRSILTRVRYSEVSIKRSVLLNVLFEKNFK